MNHSRHPKRAHKKHPFTALFIGTLLILTCTATAQTQSEQRRTIPLSIAGKPATSACLTMGDQPLDHSDIARSPMLSQLAHIAGELDARALAKLRRSLGSPTPLPSDYNAIGTLKISRTKDDVDLTIVKLTDGSLAITSPNDPTTGTIIDPSILESIGINLAIVDGIEPRNLNAEPAPDHAAFKHYQSPALLDTKTRRSRFKHPYPELTRTLNNERFRIRLPNSDPTDQPPGILLWISPTPNGQIPRIFHNACDQLNLIAVGVNNNGNDRPLTDRLQNHLDSISTVESHYRIDTRRIYVTGMSGGGRCSSILQLAFPDIFMGSVPIVGLDSYHRTPTGSPGKYWPERLARPAARWFRLLIARRIAAITGTMDFNAPEMRTRSNQMKKDGINIRLDIIDGMGHTMPSPEQFSDALKWVNQLQQDHINQAAQDAQKSLDTLLKRSNQDFENDPRARKVLIQITIDAPWSDAAWEAARLLGIED